MKALFSLLVLAFSSASMAHVCHISLYDPYNRPYLNFYTKMDVNCQEAANACYQSISNRRLDPNYFKCYTISMTNDPQAPVVARPEPRTIPATTSVSSSTSDKDHQRAIEMGETVIYNGQYWIASSPENGLYELKPEGGKKRDIVHGVTRRELAITRGCLREICTKSAVIVRSTKEYMAVEGIDYNGRYIVKDVTNDKLTLNVDFMYLVRTEGCVDNGFGKICVGYKVLDRNNYAFEVVGIQSEGLVVLKDERQKLYFSINPIGLGVTN